MTTRSWPVQLLIAVRRNWWVVVGSVLVAVVVAVGLNLDERTTYQAAATVTADLTALSANARLQKPEAVVIEAKSPSFVDELGQATRLPVDEVREGLHIYASGAPATAIVVQFSHEDEQTALDAADAGAELMLETAYGLMEPELARQRQLLQVSKDALEVLEAAEDPWMVEGQRWSILRTTIVDEDNLALYEQSYLYDGRVAASAATRFDKLKNAGVGGLLLGLVVGVFLAGVRDYLSRREVSSQG